DAALAVLPSGLGPPLSQAVPSPAAPSDLSVIDVTWPYGGSDYDPWIQMTWPTGMNLVGARTVIARAAGKVLTLTGQPYWDSTVTFAPNEISHMFVGGQLPNSAGYDSWHFQFSGDGQNL